MVIPSCCPRAGGGNALGQESQLRDAEQPGVEGPRGHARDIVDGVPAISEAEKKMTKEDTCLPREIQESKHRHVL